MGNIQQDARKKRTRKAPKKITLKSRHDESFLPSDVDPNILGDFITHCITKGAAVLWTVSRDGGAFGVKLFHDDIKMDTLWLKNVDELDELAEQLNVAVSNTD